MANAGAATLQVAHGLASSLRQLRPEYTRPISVHKLTPDGRSWLVYAERWWPLEENAVQSLWEARPEEPTRGVIMGRQVDFPRRTAAFGVDYRYTGQVQRSAPLERAPAPLQEATAALHRVQGLEALNALLVNWYDATKGEYMGAHSDDEKELIRSAPVLSLSWTTAGHYRRFRFTPKKHVADALAPDAWGFGPGCLPLRNGCLVVMGGLCQSTHKHELMKPTKALGESGGRRINLTLRAFGAASAQASRKRQRTEGSEPASVLAAASHAAAMGTAGVAGAEPRHEAAAEVQ